MRLKFRARMVVLGITVTLLTMYTFWTSGHAPAQPNAMDDDAPHGNFLVLTVAVTNSSNYRRFARSAKVNGLALKVLGLGINWNGWGEKLSLLEQELESHKHVADRVVLFCASDGVLINAGADEILKKFEQTGARILFSASNAWSDAESAARFPQANGGKKFLSSGMFIGYAPEFYRMITSAPFTEETSEHLFYAHSYLDEKVRNELGLWLDHQSRIFQNVDDDHESVEIRFEGDDQYIYNKVHSTRPLVIRSSGTCKFQFHIIKNYVPKMWKADGGCGECLEDMLDLSSLKEEHYPTVVMAVFIERASLIGDFLEKIQMLDYPKEKIHLVINNELKYKTKVVSNFIQKYGADYESVRLVVHERSNMSKKDVGIEECVKRTCDFYFNIDSVAHLDNPQTLRLLMEQNRQMVAPMLSGSTGQKNYRDVALADSCQNAIQIVKDVNISTSYRGLFSVGAVSKCYLIRGDVILNPATRPVYGQQVLPDPDAALSELMNTFDVDVFASNRYEFGILIT